MSKPRLAETVETAASEDAKANPKAYAKADAKGEAAAARKAPKLHPSRFHLDEHAHNTWAAHPERTVAFEELLDPAFWGHVSEQKLRPGDTILIYPADSSYRAALAVRAAGKLYAQVAVLWKTDFPELELVDVGARFTTGWVDPQTRWAVLRLKDKTVMQGGFDSQSAAMAWLGVNARSLAS